MTGRGRPIGPRYPLHELEEWLGWPTANELASVLGASRAAVKGWRVRGLSERQADELACRFNLHPMLLWPGWLEGVGQDCTRRAAPIYAGESHLTEMVRQGATQASTPLRPARRRRTAAPVSAMDRQTAVVLGELLDA
ncbi:hypothetical protein BH10ACT1_BH10ACT1_33450 [soil metagenome]